MAVLNDLAACCRPGTPDLRERLRVLVDLLIERGDPLGVALTEIASDPWLHPIGVESFSAPHDTGTLRFDVPVFAFVPFARAIGVEAGARAPDVELALLPPLGVSRSFRAGRPDDGSPFDPRVEAPPLCADVEPFLIARTALSVRVYRAVCAATQWRQFIGDDDHSLDPVSLRLEEADARCEELGLVLPTEIEWELAASGGTETPFWCGSCLDARLVRFDATQPAWAVEAGARPMTVVPVASLGRLGARAGAALPALRAALEPRTDAPAVRRAIELIETGVSDRG